MDHEYCLNCEILIEKDDKTITIDDYDCIFCGEDEKVSIITNYTNNKRVIWCFRCGKSSVI